LAGIGGEGDRHGGDRARLDDEHERPAVEEAPERPVQLAQVDVLPAGARHGGGQVPVAERARHGERPGDGPHGEQPAGRRQPARDVGRDDEDARADHRAGDQRGRVEEAEPRLEAGGFRAPLASAPRGHRELGLAGRWFARWGRATVFWARLLPVVRTFIALPAGIARMELWPFVWLTFAGSLPWCWALAYAGFKLAENWNEVHER